MQEEMNMQKLSENQMIEKFSGMLSNRMEKADWYYTYSDDHSVWKKGVAETGKIIDDLKLLSRFDGGLDEAKRLWQQYVPPHSINSPNFFAQPAVLNSVLEGMIMKQDIPAVQQILQQEQNKGDRFVAFDSDALAVPVNRFVGFSSAIAANDYSYNKTTLETTYVVEPISKMQKEIEQMGAPQKETILKQVAQRLQEYRQTDAHSRGSGLSR